MATKFEKIYSDLNNELSEYREKFNYANISEAFGHYVIKLLFGITDEEAFDCGTDGYDDQGIDAIYFEEDKIVHFFQFKFPSQSKGISHGITDDEILKLTNGIELFTGSCDSFDSVKWNEILKEKRTDFLSKDIYDYKLWIVRYCNQNVNQSTEGKLNQFANRYYNNTGNKVEYEFIMASDFVKLYENTTKNIWPDFKLHYSKSLTPFSDEKSSISSAYVSLKSVYEAFYDIQNVVFEGNVRYLNPNSKINDGIKNTILNDESNFHLLNNGVTIVCKECKDNNAKLFFDIKSGSIINGAQTIGTIIGTLSQMSDQELVKYMNSFVFFRIVSFNDESAMVNNMVYTLNTQNPMKNSYTIANNISLKKLQERINDETDFFLEVKNNEFNYCKVNDKNFTKLAKNKIDIETFFQVYTAFYNVNKMAFLAKNGKASLFTLENSEKIINELDFAKSIFAYKLYLKLMDIIKEYRAFRKNNQKIEILKTMEIEENEIDEYRFLNTGNYVILFALGLVHSKFEIDIEKNIVLLIKTLRVIFKKEKSISNATKIKETFDKIEKYVSKFELNNGLIVAPKKFN